MRHNHFQKLLKHNFTHCQYSFTRCQFSCNSTVATFLYIFIFGRSGSLFSNFAWTDWLYFMWKTNKLTFPSASRQCDLIFKGEVEYRALLQKTVSLFGLLSKYSISELSAWSLSDCISAETRNEKTFTVCILSLSEGTLSLFIDIYWIFGCVAWKPYTDRCCCLFFFAAVVSDCVNASSVGGKVISSIWQCGIMSKCRYTYLQIMYFL